METKHSYIEESGKENQTKPADDNANNKDQKNIPRTDPSLKTGYNEKNPSQPQGGFTPESQADNNAEKNQGDESE